MSSAVPLILAEALTVHAGGRPVLEGLDLETRGDRVVLTGAAGAFVATLMGFALGAADATADPPRVTSGSLRLSGRDVASGAHLASLGVAPFEPPLPAGDTVRELVAWGARLAGVAGPFPFRGRAALCAATAVLERLGGAHLAARKVGGLGTLERRAVVLARALVGAPEVLLVADPLAGLDGAATRYLLDALRTAGEGLRTIVWLSRPELGGPEGTVLREASDLVVFGAGHVVAAGAPDEVLAGAHLYELTVRAGAAALCDALVARGGVVRGGPEHFCLGLPDGLGPSDVLREALRVEAAVVRCSPLLG